MTAILQNASQPQKSRLGWLVGIGMLLVGATGALHELQTAVNRAWQVEPDPRHPALGGFLIKRLLSLALLLGNEGAGVRAELSEKSTQRVAIPIAPGAESLNVAAAAAILLWECSRAG